MSDFDDFGMVLMLLGMLGVIAITFYVNITVARRNRIAASKVMGRAIGRSVLNLLLYYVVLVVLSLIFALPQGLMEEMLGKQATMVLLVYPRFFAAPLIVWGVEAKAARRKYAASPQPS